MQIHSAERRVSLSAGELAGFRLGPSGGAEAGSTGRWRLALGSAWHESLRQELHEQFANAAQPDLLSAGSSSTAVASGATGGSEADGVATQPEAAHAQAAADAARSEVPLAVTFIEGGWRFEVSGRIDQLLPQPDGSGVLLREIKTTSLTLPVDENELREQFPQYLRQLALYAYGWQVLAASQAISESADAAVNAVNAATENTAPRPKAHSKKTAKKSVRATAVATAAAAPAAATAQPAAETLTAPVDSPLPTAEVSGELCFVSITDGSRQSLRLSPAQARQIATETMHRLLPFLNERSRSQRLLPQRPALPAFEQYREGQEETLHELRARMLATPVTVFEAPTGFGKTGIVLEAALEQLRSGVFSRVIYLSGKTTGQHQVMRQLRQMNAQEQWRVFQLRSRAEHVRQPLRLRPRAGTAQELLRSANRLQWQDFGIFPHKLLDEQRADVDSLRQLASRTGLCPFELAKACLPYADIWIGDYNYVFSPRNRRVFFDQPGFDPAQTLLIVDEVHNLASRVADTLSPSLSASQAEAVAMDLRLAGAPFLLQQAWELWAAFLQGIKAADELPAQTGTDAARLLSVICSRTQECQIDEEALQPFTREAIGEAFWQSQCLSQYANVPRLIWSPRQGVLNSTCLDASEFTGQTLRRFGASVLMSATVGPLPVFAESLGLTESQMHYVSGQTAWRDQAYEVAIDTTVDTRLRSRPQYYEKTAATIGRFAQGARGPLTVFFPSYQYAEVIQKYLEALHPELIVKLQPRAIDPGGQLTFVEESLLLAHVLLFVLGSSFSESIDHLGGRVDRALVVGPALPEVNPVQTARLARLESLGREEAFRRVYQIPALQKINQALGRLVRAPGQSARVLLHDQRFAGNSYRTLLAPEYRQAQVLGNEAELRQWLV